MHEPCCGWRASDGRGLGVNNKEIGKRIRLRREELRRTQEEVAEDCGLSPCQLSHIETGRRYPSVPALVRIAEVLMVPVGQFFGDTPSPVRRVLCPLCDGQGVVIKLKATQYNAAMVRTLQALPQRCTWKPLA